MEMRRGMIFISVFYQLENPDSDESVFTVGSAPFPLVALGPGTLLRCSKGEQDE